MAADGVALPSLARLKTASVSGPTADEPWDPYYTFYSKRAFQAKGMVYDFNPDVHHLIDSFVEQWDLLLPNQKAVLSTRDRHYYVCGDPVWWSTPLDKGFYRGGEREAADYKFLNGVAAGPFSDGPEVDKLHSYEWPKPGEGKEGAFEIGTPYPVHVQWFYSMPKHFMDVDIKKQPFSSDFKSKPYTDKYHEILNPTNPTVKGEPFRAVYCALMRLDFIGAGQQIRVCGQMLYTAQGDVPTADARASGNTGQADPEAHKHAMTLMLMKVPYYDLGKEIGGFAPGTRGALALNQKFEAGLV